MMTGLFPLAVISDCVVYSCPSKPQSGIKQREKTASNSFVPGLLQ